MTIANLPSYPSLGFGLGETADMLRDSVQRFAAEHIAPRAAQIDRDNDFPADLWSHLGDAGLLGITVVQCGLGGVQAEQVAAELDASAKPPVDGGSAPEAARADPPVPEPVAFADPSIRVELARALAGSVQAGDASPAGAATLSAEEQAHCLQLMRGCSLFRLCPQVQLSQIVGRLSRASHRRLLYVIALQEDEEERAPVVNQPNSAPKPEAPAEVAATVAKHEVQSRQEEPDAQSAASLQTEGAERQASDGDLVSCLIDALFSELLDELGGAQAQ